MRFGRVLFRVASINSPNRRRFLQGLALGATFAGGLALVANKRREAWCAEVAVPLLSELTEEQIALASRAGVHVQGLPEYSRADVALRSGKDGGPVWVTFRGGVYDITNWIEHHPGGDKILAAAGGSIEPFWAMYASHMRDDVKAILETYRIGNVAAVDLKQTHSEGDPYSADPERMPGLLVHNERPFNAEPPGAVLAENFITPTDLFYVRNHLPVPNVDLSGYRLEISGLGLPEAVAFTLEELQRKFHQHTVTATIQCAGNRRKEMIDIKPVKGLAWRQAAIANAEWTGVRLRDVLLYAGLDLSTEPEAQHVQFEGLDKDATNATYGASVPIRTILDPYGDVLLAWNMNGAPLTRDHGYPLRAIVPGTVGARNVKWLQRVHLSTEESTSFWQQNDYKGFGPNTDWNTVDFGCAPAIQELPVQSAICDPSPGTKIDPDTTSVTVKGYAWSGGGKDIVRVDVSGDGGKEWFTARTLQPDVPVHGSKRWSWTLWEVDIPTEKVRGELCCKAVDAAYNTQPDTVAPIWNLRGVLNNAWHRVPVQQYPLHLSS
eukprot:TRINITY_DN12371_c0_g1_i2.p1 TRINITY_DN12371_c0_g1~~TRINITY_DN12371_c0_g1_i2.p1  ORF type:complete len:549 (-),score=49.93 TRINITY_DN12371_c0_g1_i2:25-1671(-)